LASKIANVLGVLPKSAHPGAKKALAEIWNAEDIDHAWAAVTAFAVAYGAKFPKAVAKVTDDEDELLAFYALPSTGFTCARPTRVHLRHGQAPDQGHRGPRLKGRRGGHGVQADRVGPAPLADGPRPAPGRAGPRRRDTRQWLARRAARRPVTVARRARATDQRGGRRRSCLKILIHRSDSFSAGPRVRLEWSG
jgi:Transposase, Mutator family